MRLFGSFTLILGLGGGLLAQSSPAPTQKNDPGVQEAIRFERAKQAAADRQARIEEAQNGADRMATRPQTRVRTTQKRKADSAPAKTPPAQH